MRKRERAARLERALVVDDDRVDKGERSEAIEAEKVYMMVRIFFTAVPPLS